MKIGTAAKKSGVSAKLIRYYESIGLIPQAARQHQGYRRYNESEVHTLRFISRARSVGFSLEEVRDLLDLWHDKSRSVAAIEDLANRQLTTVYRKIDELRCMQRALEDLVERCDADDRAEPRNADQSPRPNLGMTERNELAADRPSGPAKSRIQDR